ncbi:Mitochondrial uncoupling protein 3 [Chlorella vulgaris]
MENDLLLKLLLSGVAASVAETATYPLDLLKTRLQLAGQLGQAAPVTLPSVVRAEGLLALYKGLAPAVLRHFPYTGIRIVAFEQLSMFSRRRLGCEEPGSILPLPVSLMLGLTAGGVAQLVAVPADLVKVRMQADGRLVAAGLQAAPRYRGVLHAFASIFRQQGAAGLWRGSLPAVQRAALVNLGELSTYQQAKQAVLASDLTGGDNVWAHAASSVCSGLAATVISTPADVVKTRLMNQEPHNPAYRGMLHCFTATLRAEGWRGLYAGFLPTWARLGPWQLVFWTTTEALRTAGGMEGF